MRQVDLRPSARAQTITRPRGTPSIVFGLLSYNVLDAGHETRVLLVTTVVVLGSVLLHGIGYPASVQACYRPAPAQ